MRTAAAGLAAAWVLLQFPTASAQDAPASPDAPAAYGPAPPPQVMGPFPEDGAQDPTRAEPQAEPTAETQRSGEFERLFGDASPAETAPTTPPRLPAPQMPLWLWGLLGLMLLALLVSRRTLFSGKREADDGILVTSRTSLGREGNLAVVEVGDGTGGRRRLLVGFGSGAPRLVADLTPMPEVLALAQETLGPRAIPTVVEAEETPSATTRRTPPPQRGPSVADRPLAAGPSDAERGGGLTTSQRWESALEAEGAAPPARRTATRPLESRGDLIAEVLAERTRRSIEVGGEIDLDEPLPAEEEPAVRGTYTFRGTQG